MASPETRTPVPEERPEEPPSAKLVRIRANDGGWIRRLPPVPRGASITVTVGDARLADIAPDGHRASGYRVVGILAGGGADGGAFVDLVVPDGLIAAEPGWWREILALAERVFSLDHGPVRLVFGDLLALHAVGPTQR